MTKGFLAGNMNIAKSPDVREKIRQAKLKHATRPCGTCGVIINTTPYNLRRVKNEFCSKPCVTVWRKSRKGENATNWKGGVITDNNGYINIYQPTHPYADNKGYVPEHRLVMEKHIGRFLEPNEIIHHLDLSKDNNSIDNLVITSREEHLKKYHYESLINRLKEQNRG